MTQYAVTCPKKVIIKSRFESDTHQAHLFPLISKRCAFISELNPSDEYNTDTIKVCSGGDQQSIRNSGSGDTLEAYLVAVFIISTNHSAKFNSVNDPAFVNRLVGINFPNKFERLASKDDEIKSHTNDIFSAMMDGAHRYYQRNRQIPLLESTKKYTKEIADSKDPFILFSREYAYEKSEFDKEYCKDIFWHYTDFTRKGGNLPEGRETFYKRFEEKYNVSKERDKINYYYNVKQI